MDTITKKLGRAQDSIKIAALDVADVVEQLAGTGQFGTQRMEHLSQAISHLNFSWSLVRAGVNGAPAVEPSVRRVEPMRVPMTAEPAI